jgi:hypothetical protein
MEVWSKILMTLSKLKHGLKVLDEDYFLPYHWRTKKLEITKNTIAYHYFLGSWVDA